MKQDCLHQDYTPAVELVRRTRAAIAADWITQQDYFIHPAYAAARPVLPFDPKPAPWQMVRRIRAALLRLRTGK